MGRIYAYYILGVYINNNLESETEGHTARNEFSEK